MTDCTRHFAKIAPKLRALFAVLTARAQVLGLSPAQMDRLIRTMHRLLRIIITVDVYVYQADLKARMLADPAWRRRVITQLGGLIGLRRWQARMGRTVESRMPGDVKSDAIENPRRENKDASSATQDTAPDAAPDAAGDENTCPFRLPPIFRTPHTRAERNIFAPTREYNFKPLSALFDVPIVVTPCELRPKRRGHKGPPNLYYPKEPLVDIAWRDDPPERRPPKNA